MNVMEIEDKELPRRVKDRSKRISDRVVIHIGGTQYPIIAQVAKRLGWIFARDDDDLWDIKWQDSGFEIDKSAKSLRSIQCINHIPGMAYIYRKNLLSQSISRMKNIVGERYYDFCPNTWILPRDFAKLTQVIDRNSKACMIVKPSTGAQGKGIYFAFHSSDIDPTQDAVVQEYISPLLIDGLKFDLRIFALVISVDPLRILLFREGLVRLCTEQYQAPSKSNMSTYAHLTNYSINKHNDQFVENQHLENEDEENHASKRRLSWLWKWIASQNHDPNDIWRGIANIINQTVISVYSHLSHLHRCRHHTNPLAVFEILGFDIMISEEWKLYLLEVNHMPSFSTHSQMDFQIKSNLIYDTFRLLNPTRDSRDIIKTIEANNSRLRLYGKKNVSNLQMQTIPALTKKIGRNKFSSSSSSSMTSTCSEGQSLWTDYVLRENENLQNFEVIYPANVNNDQITRGMQYFYDCLLERSNQCYCTWGFNAPTRQFTPLNYLNHVKSMSNILSWSQRLQFHDYYSNNIKTDQCPRKIHSPSGDNNHLGAASSSSSSDLTESHENTSTRKCIHDINIVLKEQENNEASKEKDREVVNQDDRHDGDDIGYLDSIEVEILSDVVDRNDNNVVENLDELPEKPENRDDNEERWSNLVYEIASQDSTSNDLCFVYNQLKLAYIDSVNQELGIGAAGNSSSSSGGSSGSCSGNDRRSSSGRGTKE